MLAAAIRIDRTVETDVGRIVVGDYFSRGIDVTDVLNGGNSSRLCQPSSKAIRASASKRPLALDCVLRPRRLSRSIETASSGKGVAPAGSEGAVTGGCLRA